MVFNKLGTRVIRMIRIHSQSDYSYILILDSHSVYNHIVLRKAQHPASVYW